MTYEGNISKKPLNTAEKVAVVFGGCGFIGHHLARRLQQEGYWVRVADNKTPEHCKLSTFTDDFYRGDLSNEGMAYNALNLGRTDVEVYQLAADMGGAQYIFSGDNDANVMSNSAAINLNVVRAMIRLGLKKVFYSSSACIYPEHNQMDPDNPNCEESSAYPANPDSEYGWEKLFSERLYMAFKRNYGIECRIARFHNIYGIEGTWRGGKEKAPAALCRKVLFTPSGRSIEMFGDGKQTRSFLYVDECVEGILRLMRSDYWKPVNIGSEEMISINDFAKMIMEVAGKEVQIEHIPGPLGVRGRSSDNRLIREVLGWEPNAPLREGITKTYNWIKQVVESEKA
jgi:nucleoside-diphosphate-sugar epimerase